MVSLLLSGVQGNIAKIELTHYVCLDEHLSFNVQSHSDSTVFPVDNVHFQQAAQISKALVDEQVDFETMVNIGSGKWD